MVTGLTPAALPPCSVSPGPGCAADAPQSASFWGQVVAHCCVGMITREGVKVMGGDIGITIRFYGHFSGRFIVYPKVCESMTIRCSPEEGQLLPVHPGAQRQTGILSKWRDDHGEDESNEDKTGREDDLRTNSSGGVVRNLRHQIRACLLYSDCKVIMYEHIVR